MKEKVRSVSRGKRSVLLSTKKSKEKGITLKALLRKKDIVEFFEFVDKYDLREEAHKLLRSRLSNA